MWSRLCCNGWTERPTGRWAPGLGMDATNIMLEALGDSYRQK
jgi:hypothetical protein